MKKIFLITLLVYVIQGKSQNLVPNYSFENMTTYTDWYNSGVVATSLDHYHFENGQWETPYSPDTNTRSSIDQIYLYWSFIDEWDVPHRKHAWCGISTGDPIGSPDLYNVNLNPIVTGPDPLPRPYSGNNWIFTGWGDGEYLVVETEVPLQTGKLYFIETFCSSSASSDEGTILLFKTYPEQCGVTHGPIEDQNNDVQIIQEIIYPGNNPVYYINQDGVESTSWTRFRTYFSPTIDMPYLVIGSGTSLMWDDIRIVEVDEIMCRDEWYFDNTVFNYPFEIFQAGDFIKAGAGVDPETGQLDGPVTVLAGSHTIFTAGNSIELLPGFSVEYGAIFETDTVPCQQLCSPFVIPDLVFDCITSPTSIGVPDYAGTYTDLDWSPALYLDNPDSINPTFTPPPGQSGSIIYTVSYTNSCPLGPSFPFPGQLNYQVTVNYLDPSLLNVSPTLSYSGLGYTDQLLNVNLNFNTAVSEITIVAYDSNGELAYIDELQRGIDYSTNSMNLSFGNIANPYWSECMDYHFVITAKNVCQGEDVSIEFDWNKTSHIPSIGPLANFISPDDDGANDFYCFNINFTDSYNFKVINEWGVTVFEETIFPVLNEWQCPWGGQDNDGDELNDGHYYVLINATNFCGEEVEWLASMYILTGKQSYGDTELEAKKESGNQIDVIITTQNSSINIHTASTEQMDVIIIDNLGKLVLDSNFSSTYTQTLASGIYYVVVISESGLTARQKIVIL